MLQQYCRVVNSPYVGFWIGRISYMTVRVFMNKIRISRHATTIPYVKGKWGRVAVKVTHLIKPPIPKHTRKKLSLRIARRQKLFCFCYWKKIAVDGIFFV